MQEAEQEVLDLADCPQRAVCAAHRGWYCSVPTSTDVLRSQMDTTVDNRRSKSKSHT